LSISSSIFLRQKIKRSKEPAIGCGSNAASLIESLNFFISDGVIDDASLTFPTTPTFFFPDCYCRDICYTGTSAYRVKIPGYQQIYPDKDSLLQRAIMDQGLLHQAEI